MAKVNLKVTVDEATANRARRYAMRHETSISRIVNDILIARPLDDGMDVGRATNENPRDDETNRARGI